MSEVDSLVIDIAVDQSGLKQGLNDAQSEIKRIGDGIRNWWKTHVEDPINEASGKATEELKKAPVKPTAPTLMEIPDAPKRDDFETREDYEKKFRSWEKKTTPAREYNKRVTKDYQEQLAKFKDETEEYNRARKEANRSDKENEDTLGRLTSRLRDIAAGYVTVSALLKRGTEAVRLRDLSNELRISVKELDSWGRAFVAAGYDANSAYDALGKIKNGLRDVALTGRNETIGMLNYLGISIRKTNGEMKTEGEILVDTAKKLRTLDPGNARKFAEMAGFDKETINLLLDTKVSLEDVYKTAQKGAMSDELAESVKDFQREWGRLTGALSTFGNIVLKYVVPPAKVLVEAITKVMDAINSNDLVAMTVAGGIALLGGKITGLTTVFGALFRGIGLASNAVKAFLAIPVGGPLMLFFGKIMLIVGAIHELYKFFTNGESIIDAFLKKLGIAAETIQAIKDFFSWSPSKVNESDNLTQGEMFAQINDPKVANNVASYYTNNSNRTQQVTIENNFNGVDFNNVDKVKKSVDKANDNAGRKFALLVGDSA